MYGNNSTPAARLTAAEAARILKISPTTIERMVQLGILSVRYFGEARPYFSLEEVLALTSQKYSKSSPESELHSCVLLRNSKQLGPALLPVIAAPLAAGARLVLILNQVESRLATLLTDPVIQYANNNARIHTLEAADFYLKDAQFDTGIVIDRLARLHAKWGASGQAMLFAGEISWALSQQPGLPLAEYETKLADFLSEHPQISTTCIYDTSLQYGEVTLTALQTHAAAWVDGVCRTGLAPVHRR